jgi:AbrB family looped-hinge helix DNA binding protein
METIARKKGLIVIPAKIRHDFKIKEGTRIEIEVNQRANSITLRPITKEYIDSLRGKFKGKGLMKELMEEKKYEKEL